MDMGPKGCNVSMKEIVKESISFSQQHSYGGKVYKMWVGLFTRAVSETFIVPALLSLTKSIGDDDQLKKY